MQDFPVKKLSSPIMADYTSAINGAADEFKKRFNNRREAIKNGFTDAPFMKFPIVLFSGLPDNLPIYKVNTPGYVYVRFKESVKSYKGTEIYLSSSASGMADSSKRMLYMVSKSANCSRLTDSMFIIPAGTSTYMTINPATSYDCVEFWFFPTIEAYSYNIADSDYVTKVGEIARTSLDSTGNAVLKLSESTLTPSSDTVIVEDKDYLIRTSADGESLVVKPVKLVLTNNITYKYNTYGIEGYYFLFVQETYLDGEGKNALNELVKSGVASYVLSRAHKGYGNQIITYSVPSGYLYNYIQPAETIFSGDWKNNFPDTSIIFGQRFAALSGMTFTSDTFKSLLKSSRRSWLSTCANGESGPSPSMYPNEM